jgi:hypothetical protein
MYALYALFEVVIIDHVGGWKSCVGFDRIEAERTQVVVVANTTKPAAGLGFLHIPLPLLSTTLSWNLIIGGFLSLHLPSLSHLALFHSLFLFLC